MNYLFRNCGILSVMLALFVPVRDAGAQVIADHRAVAAFDSIPAEWIDSVKCMLLVMPGESHGRGYQYGMDLLEAQDSTYASVVNWTGAPGAYTTSHLRSSRTYRYGSSWSTSCGEEDYWTNSTAVGNIETGLTYTRAGYTGRIVMGFGWCWDMTWHDWRGWVSIINGEDPVYGCHWDGSTVGGPQGITRWGLDAEDSVLTGNSVCMQTYLDAVAGYNAHETGIVSMFTTGPVDGSHGSEAGYQRWLKHEYIRESVDANGGYLFDYADILCWDNGAQYMDSWDGHDFQNGDPDLASGGSGYDGGDGGCHISEEGCVAVAKAMWWMLARIAGWDGTPGDTTGADVPVVLTSFDAVYEDGGVRLDWHTATETGNLGWHVYRQVGEDDYIRITDALVPGQGTSAEPHTYTFTDANVPAGSRMLRYYLIQYDADGGTGQSPTVRIMPATAEVGMPEGRAAAVVCSNPVRTSALFSVPAGSRVCVYDRGGIQVVRLVAGNAGARWDAAAAAPGVYYYECIAAGRIHAGRLIKTD